MSLDVNALADAIRAQYTTAITFPVVNDYPADFATEYGEYAKAGTVVGATSEEGDIGIIEAALRAAPTTSEELGLAFAQYWGTVTLAPAAPNISVVNDAMAYVGDFVAAVEESIRDTRSEPYFLDFLTRIEAVAKQVTWTITPPPPLPPFTSGIS